MAGKRRAGASGMTGPDPERKRTLRKGQKINREELIPSAYAPLCPSAKRRDPFTQLPFDCARMILDHLHIQGILHCEKVSRGWREVVDSWIFLGGLRLHFPELCSQERLQSSSKAVRAYKSRGVAKINLFSGMSTGIRKFVADERFFVTAGDYVAWKEGDDIFWNNLRYQPDGSFEYIMKLDFDLQDAVINMLLNDDGYLLVRTQPYRLWYRDHLFNLETGKKLWENDTHIDIRLAESLSPLTRPLLLGTDTAYFVTASHETWDLIALDLRTGEEIYRVQHNSHDYGYWYESAQHLHPKDSQRHISRNSTILLKIRGREILVGLAVARIHKHEYGLFPASASLLIIDGETGKGMQNVDIHGNDITYLVPSDRSEGELAVISRQRSFLPTPYSIQWIAPGTNGLFQTYDRITIYSRSNALRDLGVAINPHKNILIGAGRRCVEIAQIDGRTGGSPGGRPAYECHRRELVLPPKNEDDVNPECFRPNLEMKKNIRHWAHLVAGDRLVVESVSPRAKASGFSGAYMQWMPKEWEYTLFYFAYRPDGRV
ncbi:hypothetical protein BDW69DRAFT_189212 [Aspergillus filifer]